ncbi:MAG: chorismate synthase [Thermoleophilia bacterium]|nr:chorismate synthase [Thermoleophilia bacterium]
MSRLRLLTAGESHGPAEVCVVAGVPAGIELLTTDIDADLARRQRGYGRGGRMQIENDRVRILAGVRYGRTLGSPLALLVDNTDYENWRAVMQSEPPLEGAAVPVTVARPGHADLAGVAKTGTGDIRDVLERSSARETVARVAAGAVAKAILRVVGVTVRARVTAVGGVTVSTVPDHTRPDSVDWATVESSVFGCDDRAAEDRMRAVVDDARAAGESLGGVFEVWAWGVCPGVGGYASPEDRLDGRLMGALGSIPAIKGVEVGEGFLAAGARGSHVHDPIVVTHEAGRPTITRPSNRAGGLEGGMTNGMPVIVRAAMKPIPTLMSPLPSVDLSTFEAVSAHRERSDVEAVAAAAVVGEAAVAWELARAVLEKFGGDSAEQLRASYGAFVDSLASRGLWRPS